MNLLLLVVSLCIIFLVLAENKNDFISPTSLFIIPITFSIFICTLYQDKWNFECGIETFCLIIIGFLSFWMGEVFIKNIIKKKNCSYELEKIDMSPSKNWLVIILGYSFISLFIVYREISNLITSSGIQYVIFQTSTKSLEGYAGSSIISITNNIMSILAILSSLIVINNLTNKCLKYRDGFLICPIIIYCIEILLQGQRGDIINFFVSNLFIVLIINFKHKNINKKKNNKFLIKFIIYIIAMLVVFYLLRNLLAKPGQNNLSFFDTISGYIGAQIDLLDRLVKEKHISYNYWGYECFYDMYSFLKKLGLITYELPNLKFPFRAYNGLGCNVYTYFKRPYVDFGLVGTWGITFICGVAFSFFYYKYIKVKNGNKKYMFYVLMYSYFINKVAMAFFDDYITLLISGNTCIKIILMYIIYNLIYNVKFRWMNKKR